MSARIIQVQFQLQLQAQVAAAKTAERRWCSLGALIDAAIEDAHLIIELKRRVADQAAAMAKIANIAAALVQTLDKTSAVGHKRSRDEP